MEPFFKIGDSKEYTFEPDEKEKYRKLRTQLGSKWKYYNYVSNPIITAINKLGYRSKTVYPIDEYYIALGCSHTFGQYLHEEDRYSNFIERHTGIPVINLGIKGGAANAMSQNLQRLMMSSYQKPKAIFAQWPQVYRYTFFAENTYKTITPNMQDYSIFKYFVDTNKVFETASSHAFEYVNSLGIPVINYSLNESSSDFFSIGKIDRIDFARDNIHFGVETNKKIANFVMEKL